MSFFIGYTQHHIDTREFSDRLAFFYANLGDPSQTQTPWYLEMVLVFAIGKLFAGAFDGDDEAGAGLPGEGMFRYVQGRLPSLSELFGLGKLGVEIHALAAVYLQNANRKEEAYLYVSGLSWSGSMVWGLTGSTDQFGTEAGYNAWVSPELGDEAFVAVGEGALEPPLVDGVHARKVCSVCLVEMTHKCLFSRRRLAAATGNPSGISDDVIEIDMPIDSPGFPPALPLRTNIKIARVTGRILSSEFCLIS